MSTIINAHIPKTGGTSFAKVLKNTYGHHHLDLYYPPPFENLLEKYYYLLPYYWRYHARSISSHNIRYYPPERFWPEARFVIFLRNPIERSVSSYLHAKRRAPHMKYGNLVPDYCESLHTWFSVDNEINTMTRFLNTLNGGGHRDKKDFEDALKQLEQYHYIGITERFAESVALIRQDVPELSAQIGYYNTNPNKKPDTGYAEQLSDAELSVVKKHNHLDIDLYNAAVEMFDARYRARLGGSFRPIEEERRQY